MGSVELFLMYTFGFAEYHMIGVTIHLYGFTEIIYFIEYIRDYFIKTFYMLVT